MLARLAIFEFDIQKYFFVYYIVVGQLCQFIFFSKQTIYFLYFLINHITVRIRKCVKVITDSLPLILKLWKILATPFCIISGSVKQCVAYRCIPVLEKNAIIQTRFSSGSVKNVLPEIRVFKQNDVVDFVLSIDFGQIITRMHFP